MSLLFFIDHCVPRSVSESLRDAGYQIELLKDHLPTDAADNLVLAHAQKLDAILITLNGDFANIINCPPAHYGGIMALQVRSHPENLRTIVIRLLTYLSAQTEPEHFRGKLFLIEAHRIRIKE
jgi:predicted nuclease of predicted toxin-antitoxin system